MAAQPRQPRMPAGLSRRAQRAWRTALAAVDDPHRYEQAVIDYCRAITRADHLHRAWQAAGAPVTCQGGSTGRTLAIHPLVAAQEAAEGHVAKLASSLGLTPDGHRRVKPRMGRPREIVPPLPSAQGVRRLTPVKPA